MDVRPPAAITAHGPEPEGKSVFLDVNFCRKALPGALSPDTLNQETTQLILAAVPGGIASIITSYVKCSEIARLI